MKRALYVLDFEREPDNDMLMLLLALVKRIANEEGIEVKFSKATRNETK